MAITIQPDFSSGELAPSLHGRVDTNEYRKGLRTARNVFVHPYGGVSNRPGTIFAAPVKDHANPPRLIPFRFKNEDTYILEFGNQYMRVMRNGYHVVETPQSITGVTQADPAVFTCVAHGYSNGDEVFIAGIDGPVELNGLRAIVANATTDTFTLTHQVTADGIGSSGYNAYVSGGKVAKIYEIATDYLQDDLFELKFIQSADVITIVHPDYAVKELQRAGHTSWSLVDPTFEPAIAAPTNLAVTQNGTTGSTSYTYRVTAIQDETFIESKYAEDSISNGNATLDGTNNISLSWTAAAGAFRYNIYKQENGLYGFLGTTEGTSFTDDGTLSPNFNTTPPNHINPFIGADNQPGAVGFFEQRRVFGNTNNAPDTMWYSVIGDFNNFSVSFPSQADDAITATLNQQQVNEIRHLVAVNDLLVFTSGAEWRVSAGADAGFSAETLRQKPQSTWGCAHLAPIIIGDKILFVQELSSAVRSFGYSFESDGYKGTDLTLLARHLFNERKLSDWAYAPTPERLLLSVRDDGLMLCLTFAPDQQVIAWARWDTKGSFKAVANIPNVDAGEDVSYVVVNRLVNGNSVHYIERLHSRRFSDIRDHYFVDCGLTLDGPKVITNVAVDANTGVVTVTSANHGFPDGDEVDLSDLVWVADVDDYGNETQPVQLNNGRFTVADTATNTFALKDEDGNYVDGSDFNAYVGGGFVRCAAEKVYGLHHLAGETVVMLGDGSVTEEMVVQADGTIQLPRKVSRAHIGLPFIADVETLEPEPARETVQGLKKRVPGVTFRVEKTRGLFVGTTFTLMDEMKLRNQELMGNPDDMLTGDFHMPIPSDYESHGRTCFRQRYPLPFTIAAIIPDLVISPPPA